MSNVNDSLIGCPQCKRETKATYSQVCQQHIDCKGCGFHGFSPVFGGIPEGSSDNSSLIEKLQEFQKRHIDHDNIIESSAIQGCITIIRQHHCEEKCVMVEILHSALGALCACRHISPIDGELVDAEIEKLKTTILAMKDASARKDEASDEAHHFPAFDDLKPSDQPSLKDAASHKFNTSEYVDINDGVKREAVVENPTNTAAIMDTGLAAPKASSAPIAERSCEIRYVEVSKFWEIYKDLPNNLCPEHDRPCSDTFRKAMDGAIVSTREPVDDEVLLCVIETAAFFESEQHPEPDDFGGLSQAVLKAIRPYLCTTEPVYLKDIDAAWIKHKETYATRITNYEFREVLKVGFDAAGVNYVD